MCHLSQVTIHSTWKDPGTFMLTANVHQISFVLNEPFYTHTHTHHPLVWWREKMYFSKLAKPIIGEKKT